MATRRLSRTIVEGGRHYQSQRERKLRNRRYRRLRFDTFGNVIGREPRAATHCQYPHDRLAPMRRWLRCQIGRPWSKVYHELCQEADARTMKGWHLRDHVRSEVEPDSWQRRYRGWGFYVDGHGVLREQTLRRGGHRAATAHRELRRATEWAAGRRVIAHEHGEALYWTARVVEKRPHAALSSRQGARLTDDEARYWHALLPVTRAELQYMPAAVSPFGRVGLRPR